MCMQEPMAALMRDGRPDAPSRNLTAFSVKRRRNHNGLNAVLSEPRESQHAVGQVLILRGDIETLFDEAIDANGFR